jgi:hypothetical protein
MVKMTRSARSALGRFVKSTSKALVDQRQNKQIKKLKTQVARLSKGEEKKWYDTVRPSTAISTSGFIQPLLDLDVWAGANDLKQYQREGNSIVMTSYTIKGEVYIDQGFASPDANNKVRILLVQMTDDNQSAPLLGDIIESPGTAPSLFSFYKIKGDRRYKVHYDKTFNLQNTTQNLTPYDTPTEPFRRKFTIRAKVPKKGLKVSYAQGSISGNGPVTNGLFVVAYSDSGTISHPAMVYKARMRFLDN